MVDTILLFQSRKKVNSVVRERPIDFVMNVQLQTMFKIQPSQGSSFHLNLRRAIKLTKKTGQHMAYICLEQFFHLWMSDEI